MWNRIRGKVIAKQVISIGQVDAQLVDIVDRCTETGNMQAIIDKCSCGSPRLGIGKKSPHSQTDSVMTSLNRKLDAGSTGSTGIPLSSAKNEYTKPVISMTSSGTVDDRRRTNTNSAHTGNGVTSQNRRDETNNTRNAQLHREQRNADGSPRNTSRHVPSSSQQQTGNDEHKHPVNSESHEKQIEKLSKDKEDSNYTTLNYDTNYVRVSPPKMTRRPKRSESGSTAESEVKLTREAQLLASRRAATVETGTIDTEKKGYREPRALPPGPETIQQSLSEGDRSHVMSEATEASETVTSGTPAGIQPKTSVNSDEAAVLLVAKKCAESDYMSLIDLQSQLSAPQITRTSSDGCSIGSGGQADKQEVVRRELDAGSSSAIKTTMFNDGESSFLQFTFTVRLDNEVTNRPSPSVVSGTVNIVQPSVSRDSGVVEDMVDGDNDAMKPVVTVGLQQGGSVVMETRNEQDTSMTNDDEGFDCVDGDIGMNHVIKSRDMDTKTESETEDTMYHSLLVNERELWPGVNGSSYEGFHQKKEADESIHMSWDEVMMEAKTLGIPLRLPTAASTAAATTQCKRADHEGRRSKSSVAARSSVARLIDHEGHVAVTLTDPDPSSVRCPHSSELSTASARGSASATMTTPQQPPAPTTRTSSPFRDRFRFCNLFGRKSASKDDSGTATSPAAAVCGTAGAASASTENGKTGSHHYHRSTSRSHHHHHHHQHEHQHHESLMTQTLPLRSTAHRSDRPMTAAILMTSSVVGSPCVVRRRPTTVVAQPNSPRSVSTSRAGFSGRHMPTENVTYRRQHSHTDPSSTYKCLPTPEINDGFDEVDGMGCQCTWKTTSTSRKTSGLISNDDHVISMPPSTVQRIYNSGAISRTDFISSLQELHKRGWYWGPMSFDEAECRLAGLPDGSFLVRDSSDDRYILSLSFRSLGATHHTRIEHCSGMFSFYSQRNGHEASNIVDFISNAVVVSRAGYCLYYLRPRAPGLAATPVRLLHPVKKRPASLLELSRTAVQRHVSGHVTGQNEATYDQLPVSSELKKYLKISDNI